MEAQDSEFEARLRALEGWRAEKAGDERESFDDQCRGRRGGGGDREGVGRGIVRHPF